MPELKTYWELNGPYILAIIWALISLKIAWEASSNSKAAVLRVLASSNKKAPSL